jgi:DNA-directed RNA polymerase sigma subunit (sigma70/sigma32)
MSRLTSELRERIRVARSEHAREQLPDGVSRHGHSDLVSFELIVALSHLTMDEREVWIDRNILNRSLESIGKSLVSDKNPNGISRERVRQLENQDVRKLAELLPENVLTNWRNEVTGNVDSEEAA